MSPTKATTGLPLIPLEVFEFASENDAQYYLGPVMKLAHGIFPGRPMTVLLEGDPEIANDWHIVFEVDVTGLSVEALLAGQRRWSEGIFQRCPATDVSIFRFGWTESA
jgi:hypothetical protein